MIGCIGAGKSMLARRIGDACRVPVVHLDQLWWEDGSYRITGHQTVAAHTMAGPAFRDLQLELAGADTWVIDGGYIPDLDTRLTRADTVVFLDLPRRVCLWRLLRRHNRRRPDYPGGVREGVGWLVILARWIWRYPSQKRPAIESAIAHAGAHRYRVDPPRGGMLVAHHDVTIPHRCPIRELQAVAAVHPDRVRTDQLELALDVQAGLLDELPAGTVLGQLPALDCPSRQEPLAREGATLALQQQDLIAPLRIDHSREPVELHIEVAARTAQHVTRHGCRLGKRCLSATPGCRDGTGPVTSIGCGRGCVQHGRDAGGHRRGTGRRVRRRG